MLGEGGSWLSKSTRQCGMITDCGKQRKPEAASGCRKQKAEEEADQSDSHANRYHFMEKLTLISSRQPLLAPLLEPQQHGDASSDGQPDNQLMMLLGAVRLLLEHEPPATLAGCTTDINPHQ